MSFKAEKTGTPTWQKVYDDKGVLIATLHQTNSNHWSISKLNSPSYVWLTDETFSNGNKAINWLWKNRFNLGEPFSLYPEEKKSKLNSVQKEEVIS